MNIPEKEVLEKKESKKISFITIKNDVLNINESFDQLKVNDLVKICYLHNKNENNYQQLGDYCYLIGYITKIDERNLVISNVNSKYPNFQFKQINFEKETSLENDKIKELEKIIFEYQH